MASTGRASLLRRQLAADATHWDGPVKGKVIVQSVLVVLLGATLLWAGPWKKKPSTEWTPEDVHRILNKSPWVRTVVPLSPILRTGVDPALKARLRELSRQRREEEQRIAQTSRGARDRINAKDSVRRTDNLRMLERSARASSARPRPLPPVGVRWVSSSTMRQAILRSKQLAGKAGGEGLKQFLSIADKYHAIAVGDRNWVEVGIPLRLSKPQLTEERLMEFRATTYLELETSEKKIFPVAVVSLSFGVVQDLIFLFPRQTDGQPSIGPQEKQAKFHHGLHDALVVEFNLTKLARDGRPDI